MHSLTEARHRPSQPRCGGFPDLLPDRSVPRRRQNDHWWSMPGLALFHHRQAVGFSDMQHRFGGHAGGGSQFFIPDHFSVDSTYRHIWLERLEPKNQNLEDKKFNDNGYMVTIGLNVHF